MFNTPIVGILSHKWLYLHDLTDEHLLTASPPPKRNPNLLMQI